MRPPLFRLEGLAALLLLPAWLLACSSETTVIREMAGGLARTASGEDRMFIKTASLRVAVDNVDESARRAAEIAEKSGGRVERSSVTEEKRASLTIRVPAAKLNAVLDDLSDLGSEQDRRISSRDVTGPMIDLETSLKNKRALRDRLRKLLKRAEDVEEVLKVEESLTRLQSEIDSMERRFNLMSDAVEMASIDLALRRKRILGPLGYLGYGLWWLFSKLFVIR